MVAKTAICYWLDFVKIGVQIFYGKPKMQYKKTQCFSQLSYVKSATIVGALLFSNLFINSAMSAPVENFGQNLSGLQQAFSQKNVHILQMGDSHTAGDYFTEQLRKRLQADIGDGGVGFAYPMKVNGQRTARHGYEAFGWELTNSRSNQPADYSLGGVIASPMSRASALTLTSQYYAGDSQDAKVMVKGNAGQTVTVSDKYGTRQLSLNNNGWQTVATTIHFPATFQADSNMNIGGFWLSRQGGGRVSAMGINGATQDYWQRWRSAVAQDLASSQADLVILAYGTNEAFQSDVSGQIASVQSAINKIRQGLPNANILIVNAPDSLKSTSGYCGTRAVNLDKVQSQLRQVAQQNGTLYWSWQEAMGGNCSMKSWIAKGLGRTDGVHFSREGYEKSANDLYDNLKKLLNNSNATGDYYSASTRNNITNDIQRTYSSSGTATITNRPANQGRAVICSTDKCSQLKN